MTVAEQIGFLIGLQTIDAQIYKFISEKELKPNEINDLKESLIQK